MQLEVCLMTTTTTKYQLSNALIIDRWNAVGLITCDTWVLAQWSMVYFHSSVGDINHAPSIRMTGHIDISNVTRHCGRSERSSAAQNRACQPGIALLLDWTPDVLMQPI